MTDIGAIALLTGMALPIAIVFYSHTRPPKSRRREYDEPRIITPVKAAPKRPKPPQVEPEQTEPKQAEPIIIEKVYRHAKHPCTVKPGPSADTIKAMHIQADAERAIAEALERKAQREKDPVKRARIGRQAANSWLRFNKILDQIDKLTPQL